MKKIIKISLVSVGVIMIGVGGYYAYDTFYSQTSSSGWDQFGFEQNISYTVERKDLISSLDFSGNTKIKNQQKLKFPWESKVTWVRVALGDNVKEWDLIAEIDKANVLTEIEILKIRLTNAQLQLKKVQENSTDIEVKRAEIEYEKLQNDLKNKQQNYDFFVKDLDQKILDAQKQLNQKKSYFAIVQREIQNSVSDLKNSPDTQTQEILQTQNRIAALEQEYQKEEKNFQANLTQKQKEYFQAIEKEYMNIQSSLHGLNKNFQEVDQLLQFRNEGNYDRQLSIYFSAKDGKYKNLSENSMQGAYAKFLILEDAFKKMPEKYLIQDIIALSDIQIDMYNDIWVASDNMMKWLDNSIESETLDAGKISSFYSIASSLYSQAFEKKTSIPNVAITLNNLKTPDEIEKEMKRELEDKKNQIVSLKQSLQKLKDTHTLTLWTLDYKIVQEQEKALDLEKEIQTLEREFQQLKQNREYEINMKRKEIDIQELELLQARKKLEEVLDTSNNQELVTAQNDYKQAKVVLENEQAKIANYEIRAPFDGIITRVDYAVGDNLGTNDEKYILIENPEILEISIFADQVDITKLMKWQKTQIRYDAFAGVEFDGEIIEIDSTPQEKDGITKYEVKILVTKTTEKIFSWMMANVVIVTEKKEQVLWVPFTAVQVDQETGESFVMVIDSSGKKQKRKVEIWYSDGNSTEILEWLKEWEKVLEIDYDANAFTPQDFEMGWFY